MRLKLYDVWNVDVIFGSTRIILSETLNSKLARRSLQMFPNPYTKNWSKSKLCIKSNLLTVIIVKSNPFVSFFNYLSTRLCWYQSKNTPRNIPLYMGGLHIPWMKFLSQFSSDPRKVWLVLNHTKGLAHQGPRICFQIVYQCCK